MFARWCQENFFKYMREHYGLDRLVEHGVSPLADTTRLVNPAWRAVDSQVRSTTQTLSRQRARFAAHTLRPEDNDPAACAPHEQRQGEQLAALRQTESELAARKARRKEQSKNIELKDLPEDQRTAQLRGARKQFIHAIKLIACRAGSALMHIARETLIRGLLQTPFNLRPDPQQGILRIELHGQANPAHNAVVNRLCEELNATETVCPGTDPRLQYIPLRPSLFPAGQDV